MRVKFELVPGIEQFSEPLKSTPAPDRLRYPGVLPRFRLRSMLELTTLTAFIGYLIYLRYYADPRTPAQIEADRLRAGIMLFENQQLSEALRYFNATIQTKPASAVAYLYPRRPRLGPD
jgi:hypothetical protein